MIKFDEKVYSLPMYKGGYTALGALATSGPECSYWHNFLRACDGNTATIRAELALQGGVLGFPAHLCFAREQDAVWFKLKWS